MKNEIKGNEQAIGRMINSQYASMKDPGQGSNTLLTKNMLLVGQ